MAVLTKKMIYIKNKSEIQKMRDACKLATEVLHETGSILKSGMSTDDLNQFADSYTIRKGAISAPLNYKGFPKSICTSVNDVVCHGIPDKTVILKDGDIINIDITVILNGYHGDTSRTFIIGHASTAVKNLVSDTEESMYKGISAINPENRIYDIGNAIDDFLSPKGYGIVRELTGHGIGRAFHERPSVPHYRNKDARERMRSGMIFTVEPMVNLGTHEVDFDQDDGWTVRTKDRKYSAQFEHTCLVTDNGYDILTKI